MNSDFPFSTARSSLLNTETFRNLLGQSLLEAKKEVVILSAFITLEGIKWLNDNFSKNIINAGINATSQLNAIKRFFRFRVL